MSIYSKHLALFCKRGGQKGFTLIELIVVSAIIFLITTFIFFQQAKFNSATLLRSLSYSVALSMRQAQVYGTSGREIRISSNVFNAAYGVYFSSAEATTYYLFADGGGGGNENGVFDNTAAERLSTFTVGRGFTISEICTVSPASPTVCTPTASLGILFRRPNPEPCIYEQGTLGACAVGATPVWQAAYVKVSNTGNSDYRYIKISSTGQIAVCPANTNTC